MKVTYSGNIGFMNEHARAILKTYRAEILEISEDEDEDIMEVTVEVQSRGHANDISGAFEAIDHDDSGLYGGRY